MAVKTQLKRIQDIIWNMLMVECDPADKKEITLDVSGPTLVILEQGPAIGWNIAICMRSRVILGNPTEAIHVPLGGILPPDEHFLKIAKGLLERLVEKRNEAENPVPQAEVKPEKPIKVSPPRVRASHFPSKPGSEAEIQDASK